MNASHSMRHMFKRELKRISHGHYRKSRSERCWTLVLILAFVALVGGVVYGTSKLDIRNVQISNFFESALVTLASALVVYIVLQVSMLFRWVAYWIIIATIILFTLGQREKMGSLESSREAAFYVFIGFICLEILTLLVYAFTRWIFPQSILYLSTKYENFWDIQQVAGRSRQYTCRDILTTRRKKFAYSGNVDDLYRPNGYGKWTSYWPYGEVLSGYWENGVPIGPFKSREYKTGFSFENLRIAFISLTDCAYNKTSTKFASYQFGVLSVECSISGRFFSDLPKTTVIFSENSPVLDVNKIMSKMLHISEIIPSSLLKNSITIRADKKANSIAVDGFERIPSGKSITITSDQGELRIEGYNKITPPLEALVFIPGFNCSVDNSGKLLAQMIALGGGLPSNVKPVVVGWPGGSLLSYFKAADISKSETLAEQIVQVVEELRLAGYLNIHILAHSMGSQIAVNLASKFSKVFAPLNATDTSLSKLMSLILLNPEVSISSFCDAYDTIKDFTDLITVYGNDRDVALLASQYIFKREAILGCNTHKIQKYEVQIATESSSELAADFMDIDVIDTTELDINIHAARHSYFSLNKLMVDDLIDLIFTKKRAMERQNRLVQLEHNVYGFLAAPSYIVN